MNSILNSTVTLTPTTILITVGPVVAVILMLVVFLFLQRRKINTMEQAAKPKYGFLGKPLYSFMAMFMLASAIGIGFLSSQGSGTNVTDVSANKKMEITITYKVERSTPAGLVVRFAAVPTINQQPWGASAAETFDFFWKIKGIQNFSESELSRTLSAPSGFTKTLPKGTYKITLDVFGENVKAQKELTIVL
jgi:hypothetical protein